MAPMKITLALMKAMKKAVKAKRAMKSSGSGGGGRGQGASGSGGGGQGQGASGSGGGGQGQGAGGSGGGGQGQGAGASGGGGDSSGEEKFVPYEFGLDLRYASGEVFHMPYIGHESGDIKILSDFLSPHHPFVLDEPVIPDRRPFRATFIFNGVALDPKRSFAYYGIKNGDLLDVVWSRVKR